MNLFFTVFFKEFLVLLRDRSGLAILFIMPLALVVIMALLTDGPYKAFQESQFPVILIDNDKDSVGGEIEKRIIESKIFIIHKSIDGVLANPESARLAVSMGKFKAGIIIPKGISKYLRNSAKILVAKTFSNRLYNEQQLYKDSPDSLKIKYFLDPLILFSFKNAVVSVLEKSISRIVSQTITDTYYDRIQSQYSLKNKIYIESCKIIDIEEICPADNTKSEGIYNSVQHNVPAWTMFAIFFIFLPLAGGIVKERDDGTFERLIIMPHSFATLILGKISLYVIVGCAQFITIILVGIYLLPLLGLPSLVVGHNTIALALVVFSAALAATGLGVFIGMIFSSHKQVATFGSISVIILSALGGIMIPVYIMSKTMIKISKYSPLEWGLNAFNDIFLHNGGFISVYLDVVKLLLFSIFSFIVCFILYRYKRVN